MTWDCDVRAEVREIFLDAQAISTEYARSCFLSYLDFRESEFARLRSYTRNKRSSQQRARELAALRAKRAANPEWYRASIEKNKARRRAA